MNELSTEARSAIDRGLRWDGPSAERRERVKGRVLVALGGGVVAAAGTVSTVAGAAGPVVSTAVSAKALLGGSLLVWFATGVGAGVSVGAVAALAQYSSRAPVPAVGPAATTRAPAPSPAPTAVTPEPEQPKADRELSPAVDLPSRDGRTVTPAPGAGPARGAPESASVGTLDPTSMSEEAALLQSAQRALAANRADEALGLLAEHEQRFPSGVLSEERRVAKVLALCALGRSDEAAILARAFIARSPRSVLVPRLESSCVKKSLGR